MSRAKAISDLARTLGIMKQHETHTPPIPEVGVFYTTYNSSIVFVHRIDPDGEARAVILKGGAGREDPGDTYWLSEDGYHRDRDAGVHLVLALREKLDLRLPD